MAREWKQEEKNRQKEIIISKAIEVFSKNGFKKTKMQDIADLSGFSKGLLYLHFKTKEDLYASILLKIYREALIEPEDDIINKNICPDDKIKKMAYMVLDLYKKYPEIISMIGSLSRKEFQEKLSDEIKSEIDKLTRKGKERFIIVIKEGINKGIYKKELEYTKIGTLFFTALHGVIFFYNDELIYHFLKDKENEPMEVYYSMMIDILLNGIKEKGDKK